MTQPNDSEKPPIDAAEQEAYQYWGYLIKEDKCGTDLMDRLLTGIANFITEKFENQAECSDITPSQLAAFYKAVGGDFDMLFIDTPPSSIAFIYRSLGCLHSLQPAPDDDGYSSPAIPALKKRGFILWQTIQLLLGPEDHVPFLQHAVQQYDIKDPKSGDVFPKILPSRSFPGKPDEEMVQWYQSVAERLRRDAEEDDKSENSSRVRVHVDEPRTSTDTGTTFNSTYDSAEERQGAAKYFSDPLYRRSRVRPSFVRKFSKVPSPRTFVEDRGRLVANSVRHMWNPFSRRRNGPGAYEDDSVSDGERTPVAGPTRYPTQIKRPHPQREDSFSSTDSSSGSDALASGHRVLRHRRSHDPPPSPREYFPPCQDEPRRYSAHAGVENRPRASEVPRYGPTKAPLFATQVAQMQSQNLYDRRPSVPRSASYRTPANVRFVRDPSPRETEPPYVRDAYDYHNHRRRRSDDRPRSREKDRDRARGHDDRSRSYDSRDREYDDRAESRGGSRTHRYVKPVVKPVDGVAGRRYPVETPWR